LCQIKRVGVLCVCILFELLLRSFNFWSMYMSRGRWEASQQLLLICTDHPRRYYYFLCPRELSITLRYLQSLYINFKFPIQFVYSHTTEGLKNAHKPSALNIFICGPDFCKHLKSSTEAARSLGQIIFTRSGFYTQFRLS